MNINDTDSESDEDNDIIDPNRPWLDQWTAYLNSNEVIPEGLGMVHWWGVCGLFLLSQNTNGLGSHGDLCGSFCRSVANVT
jgi:hypothetical protein